MMKNDEKMQKLDEKIRNSQVEQLKKDIEDYGIIRVLRSRLNYSEKDANDFLSEFIFSSESLEIEEVINMIL